MINALIQIWHMICINRVTFLQVIMCSSRMQIRRKFPWSGQIIMIIAMWIGSLASAYTLFSTGGLVWV